MTICRSIHQGIVQGEINKATSLLKRVSCKRCEICIQTEISIRTFLHAVFYYWENVIRTDTSRLNYSLFEFFEKLRSLLKRIFGIFIFGSIYYIEHLETLELQIFYIKFSQSLVLKISQTLYNDRK